MSTEIKSNAGFSVVTIPVCYFAEVVEREADWGSKVEGYVISNNLEFFQQYIKEYNLKNTSPGWSMTIDADVRIAMAKDKLIEVCKSKIEDHFILHVGRNVGEYVGIINDKFLKTMFK